MTGLRIGAYLLLILFFLLSLGCVRDHVRGTTKPGFMLGGTLADPISRDLNPKGFRDVMLGNWGFALLPGVLGLFLLGLIARQDSLDPLSTNVRGKKGLRNVDSGPRDSSIDKGSGS